VSPSEAELVRHVLATKAATLLVVAKATCTGDATAIALSLRVAAETARLDALALVSGAERARTAKLIDAVAEDVSTRANALLEQRAEGAEIARRALEGE
jgi:hypothetical protein